MIRIEVRKVRSSNGQEGFLVLKASCLPVERLPKEYIGLKEPGDISIVQDEEGILVQKIDDDINLCWILLKVGTAYQKDAFLRCWEDVKLAGNRLTRIKRELEASWSGTLTLKY